MSLAECRSDRVPHGLNKIQFKITDLFQSAISLYLKWHRYRMAINDLRTLDNRLLKDIGFDHSGVSDPTDAKLHHYRGIY